MSPNVSSILPLLIFQHLVSTVCMTRKEIGYDLLPIQNWHIWAERSHAFREKGKTQLQTVIMKPGAQHRPKVSDMMHTCSLRHVHMQVYSLAHAGEYIYESLRLRKVVMNDSETCPIYAIRLARDMLHSFAPQERKERNAKERQEYASYAPSSHDAY